MAHVLSSTRKRLQTFRLILPRPNMAPGKARGGRTCGADCDVNAQRAQCAGALRGD